MIHNLLLFLAVFCLIFNFYTNALLLFLLLLLLLVSCNQQNTLQNIEQTNLLPPLLESSRNFIQDNYRLFIYRKNSAAASKTKKEENTSKTIVDNRFQEREKMSFYSKEDKSLPSTWNSYLYLHRNSLSPTFGHWFTRRIHCLFALVSPSWRSHLHEEGHLDEQHWEQDSSCSLDAL